MVITFDDQFLLTVSEDGCLFIWKIIDKEGQGLKREKELIYTEEILVTKLDLEEKVTWGIFFFFKWPNIKLSNYVLEPS